MYAFISGKVYSVKSDEAIIDNHGIGYRIYMSNTSKLKLNTDVFLLVYEQISEDAHTLYGFLAQEEYDLFTQLIKVKGVGCKSAITAMSTAQAVDIISAIERSDVAFMKRLPGIGAKTASQIIVDLKGKLVHAEVNSTTNSPMLTEVEQALKSLGYKSGEITPILKQLQIEGKSVDQLIKQALSLMLKAKGG